ncbi:hypothetical protein CK556_01985 [Mesoplasma chauliocola]|uniref:Uncharacterized protein n=1 Tax=Mesoplasma chauliocola TaxID=216427 RepID=A0A249SN83_9MOLU|nr:ETX/MTX2 family pore-forming toxin [Mesoplasma chauliocola]ASZ09125.1 hypothetical protein CK556_01985 [Mesoplasma chauliocola]
MKFLLSILGSLNVFSISTASLITTSANNETNINIKEGETFTNINDYLKTILLEYFYTQYKNLVDDDTFPVCNVDSFEILNPTFFNSPEMTETSTKHGEKKLIHQEIDKLTNSTSEKQTMQSASFSKTYTDLVSYSVTKSVGLELSAPIKFLNTKLSFSLSSTSTTTESTETILTAPSQSVNVESKKTDDVIYNIYEQDNYYNELIKGELNPNTVVRAKFTNSMSVWSNDYRVYGIEDSIGQIMSVLESIGQAPSKDNVIYKDGDKIFIQTTAEIETNANQLEVEIKPESIKNS